MRTRCEFQIWSRSGCFWGNCTQWGLGTGTNLLLSGLECSTPELPLEATLWPTSDTVRSGQLVGKKLTTRHWQTSYFFAIFLRPDIIHGKLFQNTRILEVDYAQGRDIPPGYTGQIVETLQAWVNSCDSVSNCIEMQIKYANAEKSKRLLNKERVEQDVSIFWFLIITIIYSMIYLIFLAIPHSSLIWRRC